MSIYRLTDPLPDGWQVFYDATPIYECRNANGELVRDALIRAQLNGVKIPFSIQKIALAQRGMRHERERVDGRLTTKCLACGCSMRLKGCRVWAERPAEPDDVGREGVRYGYAQRDGQMVRIVEEHSRYGRSKQQARKLASELHGELGS